MNCRQENLDISRDELDLVVLAQIRASHKPYSHYLFPLNRNNKLAVLPTLHCIGRTQFDNLVQQYSLVIRKRPRRVPGHRDKVMVLPSDITTTYVHQKNKQACEEKTVLYSFDTTQAIPFSLVQFTSSLQGSVLYLGLTVKRSHVR